MACLVESEDDPLLRIDLTSVEVGDGFLVLFLVDPDSAGKRICDLWAGPMPENRRIDVRATDYDGSEAVLVVQEFDNPPGLDTLARSAAFLKEVRIRVRKGEQALILPAVDLEVPGKPSPPDLAEDVDTLPLLTWSLGAYSQPAPKVKLYFGMSNPPPLLSREDLLDTGEGIGPLRPDQIYYWRIESRRADQSVLGPIWSFRTRPAPPTGLNLRTPGFLRIGDTVRLRPELRTGTRVRFAVVPPLPEGFRFDDSTGAIEGVAAGPDTAGTEYTLEAANGSGKARAKFVLAVRPRAVDVAGFWPDSADRIRIAWRAGSETQPRALMDGPLPAERSDSLEIPDWDGQAAELHISGWLGGRHHWDCRLEIAEGRPSRNLSGLPIPTVLSPRPGEMPGSTVDFRWSMPRRDPPARVTLFLGHDSDKVVPYTPADTVLPGIPVLPDTTYHWGIRVEWAQFGSFTGYRTFRTLPLLPARLDYAGDTLLSIGGTARLFPRYEGGGRVTYSVQPPLPAGLSLDSLTGEITGQPMDTLSLREYRVRAANAAGWMEDTVRLRVLRRILAVEIPEALRSADSVGIWLRDTDGDLLEAFYQGPIPADGKVERSPGVYGGGPALLHIQAFVAGALHGEQVYSLDQGAGKLAVLSAAAVAAPFQPAPPDGAVDVDTALVLSWKRLETFPPHPLARLFLGEAEPPPPAEDSIAGTESKVFQLKPDQVYRWRVALSRGPQSAQSAVWTFRTRPSPPRSLVYPADSVIHLGLPVSWSPSYQGGGRVRYRVRPALPAGLALDSLTGRIEGVPSATAPRSEHLLTVSNVSGSVEARLPIRVDHRLIDLRLPDSARQAEVLQAYLLGTLGNLLDTLWDGAPPADLRLRRPSPRYDGISAELLALVWRGGRLVQEHRFAVTGPAAAISPLPLPEFRLPHTPFPADGAAAVDTHLVLSWSHGISLPPLPLSRFFLGTSASPPLLADSLVHAGSGPHPLLPDTEYRWRIESLRAGRRVMGPVWTFRTRPSPPASLAYPAGDTAVPADRPVRLVPAYAGGRAVFRISPSLPAGLEFDTLTGSISGTPRVLTGRIAYQVTAANVSGIRSATLHLEVTARLIDFTLPALDPEADSVVVRLLDTAGGLIHLLWNAPAPGIRAQTRPAPGYDGGPSILLMQAFRAGLLVAESRQRVITSQGIREELPPASLPQPALLHPPDGMLVEDSIIHLSWSRGGNLDPPARSILRFQEDPWYHYFNGTDTLRGENHAICTQPILDGWPNSCLLTDTVYTWWVETYRLDSVRASVPRTLRTRTTGPRALAYVAADSLLTLGFNRTFWPVYEGGRDARFRVSPPLPAGLSLDSLTGILSGTPSAEAPRTEYVITVSNPAGSMEWRQFLRVQSPPVVNLVARWDLEGDGADSSGNGHHGTLGGAVAWVDGVKGRALSLAGAGFMRVDVRDGLHLNGFTLSVWTSQTGESRQPGPPVLEYSEPGWLVGLHLGLNTHGWGSHFPGDTYVNIRPADALPSGQMDGSVRERNILWASEPAGAGNWIHHVVTFDPTTWQARIYLNGVLATEMDLQPGFQPLTRGRICLGFRPGDLLENMTETGFHGRIDQVEIFDGPLDEAAVLRKYREINP